MDVNYSSDIPVIAGGFLGGLSFQDIKEIIGGLGDGIEENDKDLNEGYDTDKLETENKSKPEKSLITDDSSSDDEFQNSKEEQDVERRKNTSLELDKKLKKVSGGGNVLQILVSLIPTVFPKSYA